MASATFLLLLPHLHFSSITTHLPKSHKLHFFSKSLKSNYPPYLLTKASINDETNNTTNGAAINGTPTKPSRRGRKKKPTSSSSSSSSSSTTPKTQTKSRTKRVNKSEPKNGTPNSNQESQSTGLYSTKEIEIDIENYDDGMNSNYDYPPLICCFGAVQKEFLPTVRVHDNQMHPDIYSEWKMLQWDPPEFSRAPGGPVSNVAIAHVRLGGRAAVIGKVGDDEFGEELVLMMNKENVQTRGVKFDKNGKTACSFMKVKFVDGKMGMEIVKEAAEDSLHGSELNMAVLKEARIFHFNSEALTSPSMQSTLLRAIEISKRFGGLVFFDLNLPFPLWRSRDETREIIKKAWNESDIVEVSRTEIEFLLDEDHYERLKNYRPQYYAESYEQTKNRRNYHHYSREEVSPLWHDGLKLLLVTDGTLRIHYYTPFFDGVIVGTEDVLITPFTCDRTGSGDAVVAAIMRKLTICPEMFENQDVLERQLRFAVAAGIISQWTIGAVRGFPTESATQNLKEQVYVPSMW